jgi:hypothetical protein
MFCTKCGKENHEDAVFCSSCGAKIGTPNSSQEQQVDSRVLIALNSVPPATVNPANIAMFSVKKSGIAMEMDDVWGEKVFHYVNPQAMQDDCSKIFVALQQLTEDKVMQFRSEGGPVVPIYRINNVYVNDWWKRLEVDVEQAGKKWFQYPDKNALHADYVILMDLMNRAKQ